MDALEAALASLGRADIWKAVWGDARNILANDDPDGADGIAAQAMLDAIAKAKGQK